MPESAATPPEPAPLPSVEDLIGRFYADLWNRWDDAAVPGRNN